MLTVKTPQQATQIINENISSYEKICEIVSINNLLGRVLFCDICSNEFVPDFDRSTVDGYAVVASSTFGCSDSIPAILDYKGEVEMGQEPDFEIDKSSCAYVPTGGQIPKGANAMVMIEYAEDFGDNTRAMLKPSAPSQHIIFRGDDVKKDQIILTAGTILQTKDIGTLSALGISEVMVCKRPRVGVISTGDELIDITQPLKKSQIRDVNTYVLCSAIESAGCEPVKIGIVKDDFKALQTAVQKSLKDCDVLLVSGGSSVGVKDATAKVFESLGEVYFHGIAIKPGKPTIFGKIGEKSVFGLPGHPLASYFIFDLFIRPMLYKIQNAKEFRNSTVAKLTAPIPSNHGRQECVPVRVFEQNEELLAEPIFNKSGLISVLAKAQGYIVIDRDCEGLSKDDLVTVTLL
jgi:molybdopterin molybdotransferase